MKTANVRADASINWSQILSTDVEADTPGGIFVFQRAARRQIRVLIKNAAPVGRSLFYRFTVTDYNGKIPHNVSGQVQALPASTLSLPITFDSTKWQLGPYDARLSLFLNKNDQTPVATRSLRLGVMSDAILGKAREGEFLYGLDAANTWIFRTQEANGLAFYRVMGVDILRSLNEGGDEDIESIGRSLQRLTGEKMQGMVMLDPPKNGDADQRRRDLKSREDLLERIARRYAGRGVGKIHYYELGNEPDLKGFYPGTMTEYAEAFAAMRAAIKRGAKAQGLKDAGTLVLNGGLSFAGAEGDTRSREFLKVVNAADLDAIAYHGHGPGIEAERAALERARGAAKDGGKTNLKYVETESGFSGNDRNGLMEQARTVVEKMTYAQSQGLPAFMFFRLFMEGSGSEGGYGLTDNLHEPRPSVMSYRNMVERLRHHTFAKSIDFDREAGVEGVNAFLFEERDAKGAPTGRKTLVAFSEKPAQYNLSLRLDNAKGAVQNSRQFDLWGNVSPATVMAGNVAALTIGAEPVYLSWQSKGSTSLVQVAPALLTVRAEEALLPGSSTRFTLLARNPDAKAREAQITVEPFARLPIRAAVSPAKIMLRSDGQAVISTLNVSLGSSDAPLALPTWWKVFLDIDPDKMNAQTLSALPDSLPGKSGAVMGQFTSTKFRASTGHRLDLAALAGGFSEKRPALVAAYLDSPRAIDLPVAASADWWMQWFVNGKSVYSTLDTGNEHGTLADHTFNLPLKKGRNVVSVLVLSGSGGWNLDMGGPKEREIAVSAGTDPDRLVISLRAGNKTIARQIVPVQIEAPVARIVGSIPQSLSQWMPLQPLAVLDESHVTNFFVKEPQQERWYKGEKDLSALVWLRDDGQLLHLTVAVSDDQWVKAKNAAQLKQSDSLQIRLQSDDGKMLLDAVVGTVGDKAVISGSAGLKVSIARDMSAAAQPRTMYQMTFPKTLVGAQPFRLNLTIADNDSNYLKQELRLSKGQRLVSSKP